MTTIAADIELEMVDEGICYCCKRPVDEVAVEERLALEQVARTTLGNMKTKGWKILMFHNMSWIAYLVNGHISLSIDFYPGEDKPKFSAMVCPELDGPRYTTQEWSNEGSYYDPNIAVENAITVVRNSIVSQQQAHRSISAVLDEILPDEKSPEVTKAFGSLTSKREKLAGQESIAITNSVGMSVIFGRSSITIPEAYALYLHLEKALFPPPAPKKVAPGHQE